MAKKTTKWTLENWQECGLKKPEEIYIEHEEGSPIFVSKIPWFGATDGRMEQNFHRSLRAAKRWLRFEYGLPHHVFRWRANPKV